MERGWKKGARVGHGVGAFWWRQELEIWAVAGALAEARLWGKHSMRGDYRLTGSRLCLDFGVWSGII